MVLVDESACFGRGVGWMDGWMPLVVFTGFGAKLCLYIYELVCLPQVTLRGGFVLKARVLCRGTCYGLLQLWELQMCMSVLARAEWGKNGVLWNRCIGDLYR